MKRSIAPRGCFHPHCRYDRERPSEDIRDALNAGMNAHAAKPIDMAVLERTVRSLLEKTDGKL